MNTFASALYTLHIAGGILLLAGLVKGGQGRIGSNLLLFLAVAASTTMGFVRALEWLPAWGIPTAVAESTMAGLGAVLWFAFASVWRWERARAASLVLMAVGSAAVAGIAAAGWLYVDRSVFPFPEGAWITSWEKASALITLVAAIVTLANIEAVFRGAGGADRWRVKYLALGAGLVSFSFLAEAAEFLLYRVVTPGWILASAAVHGAGLAVAAYAVWRRAPLAARITLSRPVVFRSFILLGVGVYLIAMGGGAWLLNRWGGDIREAILGLFFAVGGILLFSVLTSETVRRRLRAHVGKNFFASRYDYRTEWLRLTDRLSRAGDLGEIGGALLDFLRESVGARSASLWLKEEGGSFRPRVFRERDPGEASLSVSSPLVGYPEHPEWIVKVEEVKMSPEFLIFSEEDWSLIDRLKPTYVVPLPGREGIMGLIFLGDVTGRSELNFEDLDFLKTVACQAAATLERMRMAVEAVEAREAETFNRLSSFLLHDLKNQTSVLTLLLRNAEENLDDPLFQRDLMKTLSASVQKMQGLVGRLSSPDAALLLDRHSADVGGFVRGVVEEFGRRIAGRAVRVVEDCESDIAANIDGGQMKKVLTNLLLNAVEAIESAAGDRSNGSDGRVVVTVARGETSPGGYGGRVRISVTDNGPGVPPEFLKDGLFKRFRTTKKKGLGIGLYHCKAIVEAHEGTIEAESVAGGGTTFTIHLPVFVPAPRIPHVS